MPSNISRDIITLKEVNFMLAIIDIGSNTIRMNVYIKKEDDFEIAFNSKEMAGLVSHIEDGVLLKSGVLKLLDVLGKFDLILKRLNITEVFPFATASLRNIKNSQEVIQKVKDTLGLDIHLVSGNEEGELGYAGASSVVKKDTGLLVDIGGGSSELVVFKNNKIRRSTSLPIGSLNFYRNYVSSILPQLSEIKEINRNAQQILELHDSNPQKIYTIVGVGGTIRALLKLKNSLYIDSDADVITFDELKDIVNRMKTPHIFQDAILKAIPNRIHTIVPGTMILYSIMKHYRSKEIIVSQAGAREGYLINYVMKKKEITYGE
jgi:exopolyphosphatase/guanosine-5'-triphosphate,3'-diphosphate pyrophosphatase